MIQLDILCIGFLERDDDGNLVRAHSTSTLIRAEGRNIVVDTSTEYMWPAVKTSFRQIGIFPEDVDTVILTHTHSDHVGNLKRYPKAKILVHKGGKSEIPGARIVEEDELQVCPGVRMVHTPGHCTEEASVFVEADRHYVCAGDAVPLEGNLKERKAPTLCTDRRLALESIDRIREFADVVIPGHDAPFMVRRSQPYRMGDHVGVVIGRDSTQFGSRLWSRIHSSEAICLCGSIEIPGRIISFQNLVAYPPSENRSTNLSPSDILRAVRPSECPGMLTIWTVTSPKR